MIRRDGASPITAEDTFCSSPSSTTFHRCCVRLVYASARIHVAMVGWQVPRFGEAEEDRVGMAIISTTRCFYSGPANCFPIRVNTYLKSD